MLSILDILVYLLGLMSWSSAVGTCLSFVFDFTIQFFHPKAASLPFITKELFDLKLALAV